jgi:hypothetical protein
MADDVLGSSSLAIPLAEDPSPQAFLDTMIVVFLE